MMSSKKKVLMKKVTKWMKPFKAGKDQGTGINAVNSECSNVRDHLDCLVEKLEKEVKWAKLQSAFDEVFTFVKQSDPRSEDLTNYIGFLDACHLPRSQMLLAFEHLRDLGIVQVAQSALELHSIDFAHPLDTNIAQFLDFLVTSSNRSHELCQEIHESKIHLQFLKILNKPALSLAKIELKTNCCKAFDTALSMFLILVNVMRLNEESRISYRDDGLIEVCASYITTSIFSFKFIVLNAILFLVDLDSDQGKKVIQTSGLTIRFLVDVMLRQALDDPDIEVDGVISRPGELLEALNYLAVNVDNAKEMIKLDVPQICIDSVNNFGENDVSEEGSEDNSNLDEDDHKAYDCDDAENELEEVQWALKLLWSLSFVAKIEHLYQLTGKLLKLKDHPDKEISSAATGLLFSTDKKAKKNRESQIPNQFMLSYCWAQKETVWKLAECLKESGARVWLDKEQMHKGQDTLEEMSKAVESSSVIIVCYSENYKESNPCRMEANYATKLKKNLVFVNVQRNYEPLGWLGFLLGTNFRFDIFDDPTFDSNFPKLIGHIGEINSDITLQATQIQHSNPPLPAADDTNSAPKISSKILHWSNEDVNKWLSSLGLENVVDSFSQLNGKDLVEMKHWQINAPGFFLKFCESRLNIEDATQVLLFSRELRIV